MPDWSGADSGGWLVGGAGLLTAIGALFKTSRDADRHDRIDPVALVTDANKAAYDALQGTIETLQIQVVALSAKLDNAEHTLALTNRKLAEVQADLLVTKTENRVLQAKVVELTELLSARS